MSAQVEETSWEAGSSGEHLGLAPDPVEVRRNAGLMAAVGAVASGVAIAYLGRAAAGGGALDWALTGVMAVLGALHLAWFVDSRTPLLVADAQGVRLRLGRSWRGLPWGSLRAVEHTPRRGWLRDGRLVLVPHTEERVLAELDARGRRQAGLSSKLYGAPLAVPLGLTTRVTGLADDEDLARALASLAGLADSGVDVVTVVPGGTPDTDEATEADEAGEAGQTLEAEQTDEAREVAPEARATASEAAPDDLGDQGEDSDAEGPRLHDPRPALAGVIVRAAGLFRRPERDGVGGTDQETESDEDHPVDSADEAEVDTEDTVPLASPTPPPARDARYAQRAELTVTADREVDDEAPSSRELRKPGSPVSLVEDTQAWGERVRPLARPAHAVAPLVIDEFAAEPADDPVVGPELRAARTRIGLSVDQLADRTRIRPHVIESMEVDDFAPCGGDFYARGHLRTLARVLGVDVGPLLEAYDDRYAHAPISPRRVFEAELATGTHGGIRGTRGGPNWSVLVAAVMAIVLAWSIAQLVTDGPDEVRQLPALSNGSGGVGGGTARADTIPVLLRAAGGGAHVVVRDGEGEVVFTGDLSYGATRSLDVVPPVRVESSDGGLEVVADGHEQGQLGDPGQPADGTFIGR